LVIRISVLMRFGNMFLVDGRVFLIEPEYRYVKRQEWRKVKE